MQSYQEGVLRLGESLAKWPGTSTHSNLDCHRGSPSMHRSGGYNRGLQYKKGTDHTSASAWSPGMTGIAAAAGEAVTSTARIGNVVSESIGESHCTKIYRVGWHQQLLAGAWRLGSTEDVLNGEVQSKSHSGIQSCPSKRRSFSGGLDPSPWTLVEANHVAQSM